MAAKSVVQEHSEKKYFIERQIKNRWLPVIGCIGYCSYSVKIVQPKRFSDFFGPLSPRVEDTLWTAAGFGLAVYIYNQKFVTKASNPWRFVYSGFSSIFFNLGSNLMMWVTAEAALHKTPSSVRLLTALSSAVGLLYLGWNYTSYLNSLTEGTENN